MRRLGISITPSMLEDEIRELRLRLTASSEKLSSGNPSLSQRILRCCFTKSFKSHSLERKTSRRSPRFITLNRLYFWLPINCTPAHKNASYYPFHLTTYRADLVFAARILIERDGIQATGKDNKLPLCSFSLPQSWIMMKWTSSLRARRLQSER